MSHFYFAGFEYDLNQKILSHENQVVELTKKSNELLLYLLENPHRLVSRDDLIEHVWKGRVVTNNTIDQCILKLRKSLSQVSQDDYIESVYGQGVRFLKTVTSEQNKANQSALSNKHWLAPAFVLLLLSSLAFLYFQKPLKQESKDLGDVVPMTHNTPIKPSLVHGAKHYLPFLINNLTDVSIDEVTIQNTASGQPELHIKATHPSQGQFDLLLRSRGDSGQVNHHRVDLVTRIQGSENHQIIGASQLGALFDQTVQWFSDQLGDTPFQQIEDMGEFSTNERALVLFFEAASAESLGNSQRAFELMSQATALDPGFKRAWYAQALALRKQGNPTKALAILSALKSQNNDFLFQIKLLTAQCHDMMRSFESAEASYDLALKLAQESGSGKKSAAVHISQAILYRKQQKFEKAETALIKAEQLIDVKTNPQLYGTIMNTYAKLLRDTHRADLAISKANLAIQAFSESGDVRYQMLSKGVLASVLLRTNELKQAERLVEEAIALSEQLKYPRGISDNRTKLAKIYQQTGRFDLSLQQWEVVLKLNDELQLIGNTAEAYVWLVRLHLAQSNVQQAETVLYRLGQLQSEHNHIDLSLLQAEAHFFVAIQKQDQSAARQYLIQLEQSNADHVLLYQGDWAVLTGAIEVAANTYWAYHDQLQHDSQIVETVSVLNRLSELYLKNNNNRVQETLELTVKYKPFAYPYLKYKAQWANQMNKPIEAVSLMEELKLKAGGFWQAQDDAMLSSMYQKL